MPDGPLAKPSMLRFRVNYDKCIQGIALLAATQPRITQYYIGKVFFFADKEHLLDWGRPISGDEYVALEHGPVPSVIYDMLKADAGLPDAVNEELAQWVTITSNGNKREVTVGEKQCRADYPALSEGEKAALLGALATYGKMPFDKIRDIAHEEPAFREAWESGLHNPIMDYEKLVPSTFENRSAFVEELRERAAFELA
ncbi:Panacea domain-containing protein [Elioraea sp.]|uniref:Panacea domain-containing protein n=1 Tax=Elioraea sp. TaxID=2185103 RepID=UPI0025BB956D|nr:Panacea domain-containing protein [Elioraea sp.]